MRKLWLLLFMLFFACFSYAGEDMARGAKQYKKQNFKQAEEYFLKAHKEKPEDVMINYNLACALYKTQQYDRALNHYQKALNNTQDLNFKSAILYNMGNSAYKNSDKQTALDYYKAALRLNSSDMQAKHNIEFIQNENKDNKDNKNDKNQNKDSSQKQQDKNQRQNDGKDDKKDNKKDGGQNQNTENKQQQNQNGSHLLDYFDGQDKQNRHNAGKDALIKQSAGSGKNW